jgi:hypothetical protein
MSKDSIRRELRTYSIYCVIYSRKESSIGLGFLRDLESKLKLKLKVYFNLSEQR